MFSGTLSSLQNTRIIYKFSLIEIKHNPQDNVPKSKKKKIYLTLEQPVQSKQNYMMALKECMFLFHSFKYFLTILEYEFYSQLFDAYFNRKVLISFNIC